VNKHAHGFTIIELLIVMAVIVVLAGLVLGTSSYVQKKGARSRAEAEIAAMSAALESYRVDNGIYPTDASTTSALNPASAADSDYRTASRFLYGELTGDRDFDRSTDTNAKSYFTFKPNMLLPPPPSAAAVSAIRDPFGNSYGYSTMKAANPNGTAGYNPTFDLWSVGDGAAGSDQSKWIKNW
jgi:prepilin-type N-terminal cleavage/methylation domain-containing protein